MGLFDELLPKSNSTASADPKSGSTGQAQDPLADTVITMSESAPIVTTPTEINTTEIQLEVIPEAAPVEKIAEDTSILVVEETPTEHEESISDLLDIQEDTIAFLKKEETPIEIMSNPDLLDTESFFENEKVSSKEDTIFSVISQKDETTETVSTPKSFKEYIQNAILSATTLLKNLSKQDAEKLAKEHEYEEQQVHFAELAKQAEEEHKKILAEKEQAEKMIAYLEEENKHAGDQKPEDINTIDTVMKSIEEMKDNTSTEENTDEDKPKDESEKKENISLI